MPTPPGASGAWSRPGLGVATSEAPRRWQSRALLAYRLVTRPTEVTWAVSISPRPGCRLSGPPKLTSFRSPPSSWPGEPGGAAARLVTVLAGESPAGGGCPATTVVISGGGKGDQLAGSPDVNVSGSDREASNLAGCSGSETGSPEMVPPRVRIVGMSRNAEPFSPGRRPLPSVDRWAHSTGGFSGVLEDDMPRKNSQRKPGTTRGSPRRSRTAKAVRINRHAVKSYCACEWDGWGRLSEDGSGQNNPNQSEDPWGRATMVACTAVCDRIQPPDPDQTELGITKHTKDEDKPSGETSMPGAGLIGTS
jgi:hypothetical protein